MPAARLDVSQHYRDYSASVNSTMSIAVVVFIVVVILAVFYLRSRESFTEDSTVCGLSASGEPVCHNPNMSQSVACWLDSNGRVNCGVGKMGTTVECRLDKNGLPVCTSP